MYEYRIENFYLSSWKTDNIDLLRCDIADFKAIINEMADKGYRYVGMEKFSDRYILCLLIFEREKQIVDDHSSVLN